jgi:Glycosyl hydrolases family 16
MKTPQRDPNHPRPPRVYPGDPNWVETPRAPSPRAEPPANMVLTPDWRVVLNENFSASNADMRKWWTRYIYQDGTLDYLNDEWERYREEGNHVCDGSQLQLTALPHNGEFWPSGMVRSKDLFDIGNGDAWYLECRMKIPAGLGVWPCFWIAGVEKAPGDDTTCLWPPEIDIAEFAINGEAGDDLTSMHCGGQGWEDYQNYTWTWTDDTFNGQWAYWQAGFDFSKAFHTHGLYYKRPEFVIYVDRKPILAGTYNWNDWQGPSPGCHIFANLAIGGGWAGRNGVDDTAMPQSLDVDYIRVYTQVAQSTIGHDLLPV